MHIKKNDNVMVLSGKEKGKTGKVLRVSLRHRKILVQSLYMATRHMRPSKERQKGQIIQKEMPVDASNVMLVCPGCSKPSRTGTAYDAKGNKSRVCKKCGATV